MSENRTSPLSASVDRIRSELDRFMEFAVDTGGKAMNAIGLGQKQATWNPTCDVVETSDEVVVRVELPGVDPQGVDIYLTGNMLTVSGEKKLPVVGDGDKSIAQERSHGKFNRSVPIPSSVNPEVASADAKNGVLTIRLAKSEREKPRQIHVTAQQ